MKKDIKYYTPTIEEFYVGFEYEMKERFTDGTVKTQEDFDNAKWIKSIFKVGDCPYIERVLNGRNSENGLCGIRVKCLSREDVIDLGFKDDGYEFTKYCKDYPYEHCDEKGVIVYLYLNKDNTISLFHKDETSLTCTIKNKSELKKILKMLNIE